MGSAVTFSGFNDIDFNLVLNSIMQQASEPLTVLQNHQTDLQSQVKSYGTLATRISTLQSAADKLADLTSLSNVSAQSSQPGAVSVSTSSDATPGEYDVVVNDLARAQVTASASASPDATTTVVASGGSLSIDGVAVTRSGDTTLQQLADAINGTDGIGVRAAVIRTGAASYRLALTSTLTGVDNAFTVTNGLTGGIGLTFTDTDGNGISGDSPEDNAVTATDASILVNNIAVTGSSNVFEDVIPGITFTALVKDPSASVHIAASPDASALSDRIQAFATAYNDVVSFMNQQRTAAGNGDSSSIGRDPVLRQISATLRTTLLGAHGTGDLTRLSQIGLSFTSTGTLEVDADRLEDAIGSDEDGVRALIGGTDGAFTAVTSLLDDYTESSGLISTVQNRLTQQIASLTKQVSAMQDRLAIQRESLQREFTEADLAISRLKQQSSSIATFGSGLGSL
jgi:flagellar hook-associated protein 2